MVSNSENDREEVNVNVKVAAPPTVAANMLNPEPIDFDGPILEMVANSVAVPLNPDNYISQVPLESDMLILTFIDATQNWANKHPEVDNAKFINNAWGNLDDIGNDN